ncbi:M20/M25/M40 family metallo-hydrolase [Subsaxibacter sp. CAU 1640]|uniref:M20/M25/M40 family metallo-hydrolase n=1 Tax=Subsaxibacter sp. CAU 1640 TaxID=2933271 RepID=UPI002004A765|nr:M20/M25/M40 family metallo-hydrolase [Subsaxibacter sp. CAU 1640]MCK7589130.1 M20/M25/M40 family metallo-hydrolase [Subsaxibacter sp. CAU 1640]
MNYLFKVLTLAICFTISMPSFAQKKSVEKIIIKSIDKSNAEALDLLRTAVNINSGTMNFEGVRKVGELFKAELDELGFKTVLTSGDDYGRAGHLIARIEGGKGPKFLLIGHLDTVFELDSPFQEYRMVNDSIMNGPGVSDMKGGDVIIILAMKALKDAGVLNSMNIEIVMTGDEEKSGKPLELSKKDLVEAAKWADIALGFENADGNRQTIVTSRRGSTDWELKVNGKPAHSSQIFTENVGVGAIYEASRILNEFYLKLSKEENLTFNPGFIIGGTSLDKNKDLTGGHALGKTNVVAQEVVVRGDIRAISPEQLENAKLEMISIASKSYNGTVAEIIFGDGGYPPMASTVGNKQLLEIYSQVSQDLGFGGITPVNPRNAGAADISFTSGYVDMAIDGLGLTGGVDDHTIRETGNLNNVSEQAKKAAVLIYRMAFKK